MEVLTKILQQGTEFDTLAETVLADRFEQLVQLVTMISDKGELPIAMALANVVTTAQMVSFFNTFKSDKKCVIMLEKKLDMLRLFFFPSNLVTGNSESCQIFYLRSLESQKVFF